MGWGGEELGGGGGEGRTVHRVSINFGAVCPDSRSFCTALFWTVQDVIASVVVPCVAVS